MNRSDVHRSIFFHVPRTGGSSIESLDWWDQWTGHFPKANEVEKRGGFFSFAFVRNPWDRFVSLYHYFATMTPDHRWYGPNEAIANHVQRCRTFADFCRGFRTWPHGNNFHFWPQTAWITGSDEKLLVDFVGRFERLQEDFDRVCRRIDAPRVLLPYRNASKHTRYQDYYDPQTRQIVAELYRSDIRLFG